jgi:arsenate reductase
VIYFLCTGNSARSQMAEGLARRSFGATHQVASAGVAPTALHPLAVAAMAEIGIDISHHRAKPIDPALVRSAAVVVTLCGDADERCPVTPPEVRRLHWDLPDPARAHGTDVERLAAFRAVRDDLARRIDQLAAEL